MTPSPACVELVKKFEGCRLDAYRCPAGELTIGYGHTRDVRPGDKITQSQADQLLSEDLAAFGREVEKAVTVPLTQPQFDALVSFAFNCKGWSRSTLLKLVNTGEFRGAADEFPKWIFADGQKLPGLARRRAAEQKLFLSR